MTKTQHTPGPWAIYGGVQHAGEFIIHKGVTDIAVTRPANGDSNANARLIAAAPDLLAALRQAYSVLMDGKPDEADDYKAEAREAARAAIAKATGK